MQFFSLVCLIVCVSYSLACKCQSQTSEEAFCKAHWVSHVKVKLRISKQPLPAGSTRKGLNNLRYAVEHKQVFKKPSNLTELPHEIFTPSEAPACGLVIEAGKEYLLAGRLDHSSLYTVLCGQVLPDDSSKVSFENVLEWNAVPKELQHAMDTYKC